MNRKKRPPVPGQFPPKKNQSSVKEVKYYGTAACLEIWKQRPDDVIRVYLTAERTKQFGSLLKSLAAQRKAYHVVGEEDLEKLTESTHHQGICMLAREKQAMEFSRFKPLLKNVKEPVVLVYLDGVENPHNLGAIIRTCAHFGVSYLLGAKGRLPSLSPSACRVAEGGAEHVRLVTLENPDKQLQELRALGFAIAITAANGEPLYQYQFTNKAIIVMGSETAGVSKQIAKHAQVALSIPGTGNVESLNVSVAFSVVVSECRRQTMGKLL